LTFSTTAQKGADLQGSSVPNTSYSITQASAPTLGAVLDVVNVHPQSGYSVRYPYGQEPVIPGGIKAGITVTAAVAVNCYVKVICEE
jgi:hypothetical protein